MIDLLTRSQSKHTVNPIIWFLLPGRLRRNQWPPSRREIRNIPIDAPVIEQWKGYERSMRWITPGSGESMRSSFCFHWECRVIYFVVKKSNQKPPLQFSDKRETS